jgi:drug/metabolite transporter (DMT)-like permease
MREFYRWARTAYAAMPSNLRGLLLMTLSVGFATGTHAVIRHLGSDMPSEEVVVIRHAFALAALSPFISRAGILRTLRARRPRLIVTRGLIGGCNALAWYKSLTLLPFVVATSLNFLAALFVTIGAVLFLGEKAGPRRWAAVAIGFSGAVIILRPGVEVITPGALLVLLSAVLSGTSLLFLKLLTRTESPLTIVTYMYLFRIGIALIPAAFHWVWPSLNDLLWFVAIGVVSSATNMAQAQAFKEADATLLAPVRFTRLVWAALIGVIAFGEIPDLWTWIGAAVIAGSISYIAYREATLRQQKKTAAEETV